MRISGHLDLVGPALIEGWLYSEVSGGQKIGLQVYIGDALFGECVGDRFRQELRDAGFGDGSCGFSFSVPELFGHLDFSQTRLRLLGSPVFLLPDEYTAVIPGETGGSVSAPGAEVGVLVS